MVLEKESLSLLRSALERLDQGFRSLPAYSPSVDLEPIHRVLLAVAERMKDNYPYGHPMYMGQMLKPPHPVARLAYALSLWINPNNHALDGGRASSRMEKEAVSHIAAMFGWEKHLGHLCSGGTMANLEALWVGRQINPGKTVLASGQAHYTHDRLCGVLGVPFESIPCDDRGRMDIDALDRRLQQGDVGTVVATVGTTATGALDPLPDILDLQAEYGFRLHADAAYGGFFILAEHLDPDTRAVLDALARVDSIVVDPHKHGLQPYGCGCILFRDPGVGKLYKHESPYTYFTSDELHLGEISLECSRAGASAVALWATQQLEPMLPNGRFARNLSRSRRAALALYQRLRSDPRFLTGPPPELDILTWAPREERAGEISATSRAIFDACADEDLHLALAALPRVLFADRWEDVEWDRDDVLCLRSCVMKPEHLEWIEPIWRALDTATNRVRAGS